MSGVDYGGGGGGGEDARIPAAGSFALTGMVNKSSPAPSSMSARWGQVG